MGKSKMRDFDPEALLEPAPSSSEDDNSQSEASDVEGADAGREHYTSVPKSKLRRKEVVPLGPRYTGSHISRDAVDSDSDDPFARGFEENSSESDGETNDTAERPGGQDAQGPSENDGELEDASDDDAGDQGDRLRALMQDARSKGSEDGSNSEDMSEDEDEDEDEDADADDNEESRAKQVRDIMQGTKTLAATLSSAAQSDISRGDAIKRQRQTWDSLLNSRIKLQPGLIATNSMAADKHKYETVDDASVEAAESAALNLLNNLTELRTSLESARSGTKRKRPVFDSSTESSEIWQSIQSSESALRSHRNAVLEKWHAKTRNASTISSRNRLNGGSQLSAGAQQSLTETLQSQLDSPHLIAKTQTPRSCAPIQASSSNPGPDPAIYDDADFYGQLLAALLEQRSTDLSANGGAEFVVQAPWQLAREAKTKKNVDTKASKGRRLRYTVIEKLQNFMAPEERNTWGDRQRDDLFKSLFGQRLRLGENDDVPSEEDEDVNNAEEQGLMLFRN